MGADPHKPLRDDVRLLGELLGDTIRAQAGDGDLRDGRARARPGQERPRRQRRRLPRARRRAVADGRGRRAADCPRLRALPPPGQHRRAASPRAPPPRLPARPAAPRRSGAPAPTRSRACSPAVSRPSACTRPSARCRWSWCSPRTRPRSRAGVWCRSTTASPRRWRRAIVPTSRCPNRTIWWRPSGARSRRRGPRATCGRSGRPRSTRCAAG